MKPLSIINPLYEMGNPFQYILHHVILAQIDLLVLNGFEKALHHGILIGLPEMGSPPLI